MNNHLTWQKITKTSMEDVHYWAERCEIPLGTIEPYNSYKDVIPLKDIIRIPFDHKDVPFNSRKPLNILILGASSDGKTQMVKNMWHTLHYHGYHCGIIEPYKMDSGRAKQGWDSPRIAPNIIPKGINLKHYIPVWSRRYLKDYLHNFTTYSTRLRTINEKEMWMGLGMNSIVAMRIMQILNKRDFRINMDTLRRQLYNVYREEGYRQIHKQSMESGMRMLDDLEYVPRINEDGILDNRFKPLDMISQWRKGHSLCFSLYGSLRNISFDIGQKIKQSSRYYETHNNKTPIMWFLLDSYHYLKNSPLVKNNLAIEEVINIGVNYRSKGLNNILEVQSLGIIDESVSEMYKIKLISPLYQKIDSLVNINIPKLAVDLLRSGKLEVNRRIHKMEWVYVDYDNEVHTFYPFTPPVQHFKEVYHPKKQ